MKKTLLLLLALSFSAQFSFGQAIKVQACARTSDVSPVKDGQGNDQRHKSAFRLDSIRIEEFSPQKTVFARIGVDGQNQWNNGVWVDECQNNMSTSDCNACNVCRNPTIGGQNAGSFIGEMTGATRCRTSQNDLFIEATDSKDVCYETSWIDVHQAGGKALFLKVGYQGNEEDGFRTMNIKINYLLSNDNIVRNFKNAWSGFLDPSVAQIRTVFLPVSTQDLRQYVETTIAPNPVNDKLNLTLQSDQSMEVGMSITQLSGRNIINKTYHIVQGNQDFNVDVSNLAQGQYILTLTSEKGQLSEQFIKN